MYPVKEKFEIALKIFELGGRGRYILSARDDGLFDILHDRGNHMLERIPHNVITAISKAKDDAAIGKIVIHYLNRGKEPGKITALLVEALLNEVDPSGKAEISIRKARFI